MFAIHTPQTLTLAVPGEDGPFTTINFRTNGADTSRCVMEIIDPDGNTQRLTFTTRGALVDQQFIDKDSAAEGAAPPLVGEDYMVDGRDTRADNPYTHVAPVDADTAYRDGQTPGHKSPEPESDEQREAREKVEHDTLDAKKKLREDAAKRREERMKAAGTWHEDGDLKTADDKAWDARRMEPHGYRDPPLDEYVKSAGYPDDKHPVATDKTFPPSDNTGIAGDRFGRDSTGEVRGNPDNSPMAPAPSSPLPGSPPAHPLDRPDVGKVNTTQSMQNPAPPYNPEPV